MQILYGNYSLRSVPIRAAIAPLNLDVEAAHIAKGSDAPILELRNADLEELGRKGGNYACQRWSSKRILSELEQCLSSAASPIRLFVQEETNP